MDICSVEKRKCVSSWIHIALLLSYCKIESTYTIADNLSSNDMMCYIVRENVLDQ